MEVEKFLEKLELKLEQVVNTLHEVKEEVGKSLARGSEKIERNEKDIQNYFKLQRECKKEEDRKIGKVKDEIQTVKTEMDIKIDKGIMTNRKLIIGGFGFCTLALGVMLVIVK